MKNGWRVLITFVCGALAICGAALMMFQIKSDAVARLFRENLFGNIAFEVRQYVGQIESGLKYGKKLENYFGIDTILGGCYTSSSYLRGVFVFDMDGGVLYSMGAREASIPNASAVRIDGAAYAVRAFMDTEYIVIDILGEGDAVTGRLMISLDAAVLSSAIEEQVTITMWQSICIAAECVLLLGILLIRRLVKNGKPLRPFKAALLLVCCALLCVFADAGLQDIRFARIAETSTAHSVQRVAQMLQQQVDMMAARGVSPDVYDINGYLQRLQESVDNVASLRLSESGVIYAEPSDAYVGAFAADYRTQALHYALILLGCAAFVLAVAALCQYIASRRRKRLGPKTLLTAGARELEKMREALMKDPAQNTLLLSCLNDGRADEAYMLRDGSVCLHDSASGVYLFAVHDAKSFRALHARIGENARVLFVTDSRLRPEIEGMLQGCRILEYTQWVLQSHTPLHIADIAGVEFIRLREEHIPWVLENYRSEEFSPENVSERIRTQNSVGAMINGALIGFISCHDNGEIGPIVVLEPYRKLGVGTNLMVRISCLQREQGRPCFSFVKEGNAISQKMCAYIGYTQTDKSTLWIYRD